MSHQDITYIQDLFAQDIKLYAAVQAALQRSGRLSIAGDELRLSS